MALSRQELAEYMILIKKYCKWKIKNPNHEQHQEDVAQEVILKLIRMNWFEENRFSEDEIRNRQIMAYIKRTVATTYSDFTKKSHDAEDGTLNPDEYEDTEVAEFDDRLYLQTAYAKITDCFNSVSKTLRNSGGVKYFHAVFWEFENYDLNLKDLASHLGYEHANPTQELNRFVDKISLCTQPFGITVSKPQVQLQFLREKIDSAGVPA